MNGKMKSIEQVECLSRVLMEQTDVIMKGLRKDFDFDNYICEKISSLLICKDSIKIIYSKLPSLVFVDVNITEVVPLNETNNLSLFAISVVSVEDTLKIKTIFENDNGILFTLYFDAKDVNVQD